MLVVYAVLISYAFGFLMNLTFWPFLVGVESTVTEANIAFVAGDSALDNLHRFLVYTVVTTSAGWDTGRAITNAIAIAVLGSAVLHTLRRAARRASYGPNPSKATVDDSLKPSTR